MAQSQQELENSALDVVTKIKQKHPLYCKKEKKHCTKDLLYQKKVFFFYKLLANLVLYGIINFGKLRQGTNSANSFPAKIQNTLQNGNFGQKKLHTQFLVTQEFSCDRAIL